ncbi:cytochrome c oxidase assembly protein [Methyloligella solikamskensis]|uniref:Cytochrome c oxidase assembly protein CtaG n=1 Tax=Methyloligella solikamskensis TaxID=1177756 RepID=A0ABW3JD23_9HYPH
MTKDNERSEETKERKPSRHGFVALSLAAVVAGMVGLSFAAVPLYRIFCQQTGYAGTPQRADVAPDEVSDHTVNVRFDANTMPDLPWSFEPETNEMTVRIGASNLAFFKATNNSDEPIVGTAVFNVAPNSAAQYFNKIQCFCFTEQRLEPGESMEMPVTFFIEPKFLDNVSTKHISDITLSYTFYRSDKGQGVAAAPTESKGKSGS